jgi:hypothetical protein
LPSSPGPTFAGSRDGNRCGPAERERLIRSSRFPAAKAMASRLNPYLNFNGNARQAMEFYAGVFGGNLSLSAFADFGAKDSPDAGRIMHGMLRHVRR